MPIGITEAADNAAAVEGRFAATAPAGRLLRVLTDDHAKPLLAYVERILGDRHLAEDIVQETLIRAWRHSVRLSANEGSTRGWLLTVARNLAIDRIRSAYVRHESPGAEHRGPVQSDHADTVTSAVDTVSLLGRLSPEHREVLLHTYFYDRTVQETARVLGIPAGTVKSRQHYALLQLRRHVGTRTASGTAAGAHRRLNPRTRQS
ncbi:sigma-70 family RNA polymerase sigma factor [Streptomyces sp. NPDC005576]|uniref:sigma-70 family RNA polymerase sigma factor n=1 Tax=Streptomyces sp. NPDC005576 TaxID=3364726 RepID=UPI0036A63B6F